jgi:hypothetical protein
MTSMHSAPACGQGHVRKSEGEEAPAPGAWNHPTNGTKPGEAEECRDRQPGLSPGGQGGMAGDVQKLARDGPVPTRIKPPDL